MTEKAARPRATAQDKAQARRLFETTTLTQAEICRRVGIGASSLCRMARDGGWLRPGVDRAELLRRVRGRVETEIQAVEQALAGAGGDAVDKAARALASLVRTLREIQKYDAEQAGRDADDDDAAPRDLDALREALAARLDRLREGGA